MSEVGEIVRSSHERYDGLGYPDGLAGEAIPIEARIVFCCDAFHAMTTDRIYRRALSVAETVRELRENSGTQFDPRWSTRCCAGSSRAASPPAEPRGPPRWSI